MRNVGDSSHITALSPRWDVEHVAGMRPADTRSISLKLPAGAGSQLDSCPGSRALSINVDGAVGSRSGLTPNADGSIDIYIQRTAPAGHESNWLPAPAGNFKLMLRAYLPGRAILDGEYHVPPVKKVR